MVLPIRIMCLTEPETLIHSLPATAQTPTIFTVAILSSPEFMSTFTAELYSWPDNLFFHNFL